MPGEDTSSSYSPSSGSSRFQEIEQRAAEHGAILDVHRAVRPLGHDLQRLRLAAHQAQAHEPVSRRLDGGFEDRLQMRHGRENRGFLVLDGRINPAMEKPFPRGGLSTATQQYVLLSGMGGI